MPLSMIDRPQVLHALPGRVRVRLPRRRPAGWARLEVRIRQSPGVRSVWVDRRTGNALVHFDPATTTPAELLSALRAEEGRGAEGPPPQRPAVRSPLPLLPDDPHTLVATAMAGRSALRVCTGLGAFPPGREFWACALEL